MSYNKAILMGNVGADPEVRSLPGGGKVATLRIATSEKFKDRNGNVMENTEWHTVVVWNKPAEFVEQKIKKGSLVFVEGKITNRSWTDAQGNKRFVTEIRAENIQDIPKKADTRPAEQEDDDLPEFMR